LGGGYILADYAKNFSFQNREQKPSKGNDFAYAEKAL